MKMFSRIYLECQGVNMLRIMSITKNIKWKIYKSKLLFLYKGSQNSTPLTNFNQNIKILYIFEHLVRWAVEK